MRHRYEEARAHVAAAATGDPADPSWRITLHFHPDRLVGGVPILERRFGSAYFRLTADALDRATFCYPDSAAEPAHFGVAARISALVALAGADQADALNDYIEAHVHGPIGLSRDVEALVLDPCYRASPVEEAASRLGCPVEWHGGFAVAAAAFLENPGYRGAEFARLGAALARDGALTPRLIGDASRAGRHDEQALKRVWHYVARFGSPELPGPRT